MQRLTAMRSCWLHGHTHFSIAQITTKGSHSATHCFHARNSTLGTTIIKRERGLGLTRSRRSPPPFSTQILMFHGCGVKTEGARRRIEQRTCALRTESGPTEPTRLRDFDINLWLYTAPRSAMFNAEGRGAHASVGASSKVE